VAGGQHPREGAQRIAEEAGGQSRLQTSAVGGFRFSFTPGQVVLLAASEEVPAVLDQVQAGEQCVVRGVKRPGEQLWCVRRGHSDRRYCLLLPVSASVSG
jgi:hypothetical protein